MKTGLQLLEEIENDWHNLKDGFPEQGKVVEVVEIKTYRAIFDKYETTLSFSAHHEYPEEKTYMWHYI